LVLLLCVREEQLWLLFFVRSSVAESFLSPVNRGLPGAARQPLTFLASPRKVSSRRATPGEGLIEERTGSVTHNQKSGKNTENPNQSSSPKSFFTTAYLNNVLFRASA
jgi:hypothetical protein